MARRKGSILDIPIIIIVVFAFAFMVIISALILTEFRDTSIANNLGLDESIMNKGISAISAMDYMFIFITIGLGIATVILAFQIKTHPIMFIFTLILTAIFTIISAFFTNAYVLITEQETISAIASDFPLIDSFMKNLPLVMALISFIVIIALYLGSRSEIGA